MAVSPVITNFKPGQQDVFQVSVNTLWHKYLINGKWNNEAIAGPGGGVAKVTANFPDQQPQITVAGGQIMVTVENDKGQILYFAQGVNSATWGAAQLP